MKPGPGEAAEPAGAVLHDGAGAQAVARRQRGERIARPGQPAHVAFASIPDKPVEQVPIGHITNGIHLLGWMKGTVRRFWRRKLTDTASNDEPAGICRETRRRIGRRQINSPEFWQRMADP